VNFQSGLRNEIGTSIKCHAMKPEETAETPTNIMVKEIEELHKLKDKSKVGKSI